MRFNLKKPCRDCPFKNDRSFIGLSADRKQEIVDSIVKDIAPFTCHKTILHDDDGEGYATDNTEHCAGAAILLEKNARPGAYLQVAARLGVYDPDKLDMGSPVFDTFDEFVESE